MIDFVVAWVDGADPIWQAKKAKATGQEVTTDACRFRDWDTLKYWFRGVEKFAPWVRYVYFVTDDQKPAWLNVDHPKLKWIKHTDFIPAEYLPTFNANTIEWNMHRIPGLSENFVYFNDDMFLISSTNEEDFFVDGLPCDNPKVQSIMPISSFDGLLFNNARLLNRHFNLRECIKRHGKLWIKNQKLKDLLRLLWFVRGTAVRGTHNHHIHIAYNKETFETLWKYEQEELHSTCLNKVRGCNDVTSWCVRDWRNFSGKFYPKKPIGRLFGTNQLDQSDELLEYIRKQKVKVICLNDNELEENYEQHKKMIVEAFEQILPKKSAFEL